MPGLTCQGLSCHGISYCPGQKGLHTHLQGAISQQLILPGALQCCNVVAEVLVLLGKLQGTRKGWLTYADQTMSTKKGSA